MHRLLRSLSLPCAPLLVLLVAAAPLGAAPAPQVPTAAPLEGGAVHIGAPVAIEVWNREVAVLRGGLGALTSETRAREAEQRILDLEDAQLGQAVATAPVRLGELVGVSFTVDGEHLFTLFEQDLDPLADQSLEQVVPTTLERLSAVLRARADQQRPRVILRGIGLTAAATAVLFLVLWLFALVKRNAIRRFRTRAARSERLRLRGIDLRPYVAEAFERSVGAVNLVAIAAALYFWLEYCLALFPYTAPWGEALGAYSSGLLHDVFGSVVGAVPDLVVVAIIFFVTRGITRTISLIVHRVERRAERVEGIAPESVRATRRLAVVLVWIFALVLAYPHLPGADSQAFKGVSVLLGLMVSLGSAGLVNQVMSGFVVLYSRAVRSGEVVRIGEDEGQVVDLGLLCTKILKPTGEEVSIPNAVVMSQATTNFSRRPGDGRAIATTTVTIGYDVPWRQVRALLLLAAERTPGVVRDPGPRVGIRALGDFYVEYVAIIQVEDAKKRAVVLSRLHAMIADAFNEFGVQIMSPHFEGQPAAPVVVPRGGEEPDPAPRFALAVEPEPAAFDPREQAEQERAAKAAAEKARAERARATRRERPGGDGAG